MSEHEINYDITFYIQATLFSILKTIQITLFFQIILYKILFNLILTPIKYLPYIISISSFIISLYSSASYNWVMKSGLFPSIITSITNSIFNYLNFYYFPFENQLKINYIIYISLVFGLIGSFLGCSTTIVKLFFGEINYNLSPSNDDNENEIFNHIFDGNHEHED